MPSAGKRVLLLIAAIWLAFSAVFAQQSNKSKSKDRYREKEQPPRAAVEQQMEQWVPLRQLAEEQLPQVLQALTEAAVASALSPSAVGQSHAYALMAAYETMARYSIRTPSLRGAVRDMPAMLTFAPADSVFYPFAALWAALETGKGLIPEQALLTQKQHNLEDLFLQRGLPPQYLTHSRRAAQDLARTMALYAQAGQQQRLLLLKDEDALTLGWANPAPEDLREGSRYRMFVREVFERGGTNASQEHRRQVEAWSQPQWLSAQWITIASAACAQQGLPFASTLRILTATSIAMADAYRQCARESRLYARNSPQAAIHQVFDPDWQPLAIGSAAETCPREQGLVAAAAASVLSQWMGERIPFHANGRSYASFREAAREAGMARFYAGHQLRDLVEAGLVSGEQLGVLVVRNWPKEQ
ncbi:MAG: hypothetical protein RMJ33_05150 [Saprospiraceae bacterium]|nr:hypothetical protein [Saprospiraceae bacterium]MDW8229208.1 hypothetical protein [Saprospiraceae bacterium]